MYNVIVIGSGPSGVSLALYLKRYNKNVLVLTTETSVLRKAGVIENYYGVGTINGEDLYNKGIEQLRYLEIDVIKEEVVRIEKNNNFEIHTDNSRYESKVLVLANGIQRSNPKIPNIALYEGKGVSYCATCDGFFFRNKKTGVVGSGSLAFEEINYLKNLTSDIILFTNNEEVKRDFDSLNIKIYNNKITNIKGENRLEYIELDNGENINLDALFIAVGTASSLTFSKTLGIEMNNNFIKVNDNYMTNIEGLFAIGDVIGGNLQIGKAVGDGVICSKEINSYLKEKI